MQTYSCCFTDSIIGEITLVKLQIIGYWKTLNKFGKKMTYGLQICRNHKPREV